MGFYEHLDLEKTNPSVINLKTEIQANKQPTNIYIDAPIEQIMSKKTGSKVITKTIVKLKESSIKVVA
tara:strand:+ start:84 stop:287 length:204 start_codon:yes stop_codon:yes gene_type:complete